MKRQTLDQLNELGQDVAQILGNGKASSKIDQDQEELTQRWDSLVQKLEDYSNQVFTRIYYYFLPFNSMYCASKIVQASD